MVKPGNLSPYWNAVQELLQDKPNRIRPDDARPLNEQHQATNCSSGLARRHSQAGLDLPGFLNEKFTSRWRYLAETEPILAARVQKEASGPYDGGLQALGGTWTSDMESAPGGAPPVWRPTPPARSNFSPQALGIGSAGSAPNWLPSQSAWHHFAWGPGAGLPGGPGFLPNTAEVLARLPSVAERVLRRLPEIPIRPSLLWEMQQQELMVVLEAAVQGIADLDPEGGWRPLAFECKIRAGRSTALASSEPGRRDKVTWDRGPG